MKTVELDKTTSDIVSLVSPHEHASSANTRAPDKPCPRTRTLLRAKNRPCGSISNMGAGEIASNNGWTGGQYSLYRVAFGLFLFLAFASLHNAGHGWWWLVAEVLVVPFTIGFRDRAFAGLLATMLVYSAVVSSVALAVVFASPPAIAAVAWVLFSHLGVPAAPYGSLEAVGRPDPGNGWHVPRLNVRANWLVLAAIYAWAGVLHVAENYPLQIPGLANHDTIALDGGVVPFGVPTAVATLGVIAGGFELAFAALATVVRLRAALWVVMLVVQAVVVVVLGQSLLDGGILALHLLLFDPAWIAPLDPQTTDEVFYDGNCGLCHRAVRFILAEDRLCTAFRFAPLGGEVFLDSLSEAQRAGLPDSVAILTADGRLLTRSTAVVHLLQRLGGIWRLLGSATRIVPATLLDTAYDGVARVRYKLFARPKDACPIIPKYLRTRFDG
jgi:predicted DCC family thiol-disulfide oxidoreductase YuxK